jgi:hypothetical protein
MQRTALRAAADADLKLARVDANADDQGSDRASTG